MRKNKTLKSKVALSLAMMSLGGNAWDVMERNFL